MERLQLNTEKETRFSWVKPTREQYDSDCAYTVAKTIYNIRESMSEHWSPCLPEVTAVNPEHEVKKKEYIHDPTEHLTEIKVGAKIPIQRWDGNGTPPFAKVLRLDVSKTRCLVSTNMGKFVFSKYNCKNKGIKFRWNSERHREYCSAYGWIDGTQLYIDQKV